MSSLMTINTKPEPVMVRGEGSYLFDDAGRRYLDFVQGWAVNALGHAPQVVRDALAAQSALLLTPSPAFHNGPQRALADALTQPEEELALTQDRHSLPVSPPQARPLEAPGRGQSQDITEDEESQIL